jgi:hypothetical protein
MLRANLPVSLALGTLRSRGAARRAGDRGHPWQVGTFNRSREAKKLNQLTDAAPGKDGKAFCFVAQAAINTLGPFAEIAREPGSWVLEPTSYHVQQIGKQKDYKLDEGYSDFMAIGQKTNLVSINVTASLPYRVPTWVKQGSYPNSAGIFYQDSAAYNKSFGLAEIVEGITRSFGIKGQPIVQNTSQATVMPVPIPILRCQWTNAVCAVFWPKTQRPMPH